MQSAAIQLRYLEIYKFEIHTYEMWKTPDEIWLLQLEWQHEGSQYSNEIAKLIIDV